MKIVRLDITNFMGIGEAKLSLDNKGLVLIQGVNLDDSSAESNGASKSSIADAILWCLYGETSRDVAAADVVNRVTGKNCVVEIHLKDGANLYSVKRWRKINICGKMSGCALAKSVSGTGLWEDLTKGTDRLTQEEIVNVLGCSKEVFTAAVYSGQEALPNLPAMTDTELKLLIEQASGVDTLVKAYKIARLKLTAIEGEQDTWRANHVYLEHLVTDSQERVEDLKSRRATYEKKRKDELTVIKSDLTTYAIEVKKKTFEVNSVNPKPVEAAIASLDAKIDAFNEEQEEDTRLSLIATEAKNELSTIRAIYNRAAQDAKEQYARLQTIKGQVGQRCGECGKPYEEHDLGDVRKLAQTKLRALLSKAQEIKEDAVAREKTAQERQSELDEFRKRKTDIGKVVSERKRLADVMATRNRAQQSLDYALENVQRLKSQIDKLTTETNPYIELVNLSEDEFDNNCKNFRASEELGVKLEEKIRIAKDVVKVFGPAGVKSAYS